MKTFLILLLTLTIISCGNKETPKDKKEIKKESLDSKLNKIDNSISKIEKDLNKKKIKLKDGVGKPILIKGLVFIKRKDANKFFKLKKTDLIKTGDLLKTSKKSSVNILFNDKSMISLVEDSKLKIDRYDYNKIEGTRDAEIELVSGKLKSWVAKLKSDDRKFSVKTVTATIGVRGTKFIVSVDDNKSSETEVDVFEGKVVVDNSKKKRVVLTQNMYIKTSVEKPIMKIKIMNDKYLKSVNVDFRNLRKDLRKELKYLDKDTIKDIHVLDKEILNLTKDNLRILNKELKMLNKETIKTISKNMKEMNKTFKHLEKDTIKDINKNLKDMNINIKNLKKGNFDSFNKNMKEMDIEIKDLKKINDNTDLDKDDDKEMKNIKVDLNRKNRSNIKIKNNKNGIQIKSRNSKLRVNDNDDIDDDMEEIETELKIEKKKIRFGKVKRKKGITIKRGVIKNGGIKSDDFDIKIDGF